MFFDTVAAHKLLKDQDNQKILVLINEYGSLSYTDLMEKTESVSERMLNYSLEDLVDLLNKNEEGQYVLTEKGQMTVKFLEEYPEYLKKFKRKKMKQTGYVLGLGCVISLIVVLILYSQGHIIFGLFYRIVFFIGLILTFYVGNVVVAVSQISERVNKNRIISGKLLCTITGGLFGSLIAMLGLAIATLISIDKGGPNFWHITGSYAAFDYIYYGSSIVIGCIIGYYIGKELAKPKYSYTIF